MSGFNRGSPNEGTCRPTQNLPCLVRSLILEAGVGSSTGSMKASCGRLLRGFCAPSLLGFANIGGGSLWGLGVDGSWARDCWV